MRHDADTVSEALGMTDKQLTECLADIAEIAHDAPDVIAFHERVRSISSVLLATALVFDASALTNIFGHLKSASALSPEGAGAAVIVSSVVGLKKFDRVTEAIEFFAQLPRELLETMVFATRVGSMSLARIVSEIMETVRKRGGWIVFGTE